MKSSSKYYPLFRHLQESGRDQLMLTFADIEQIIEATLPSGAKTTRAWWSNRTSGSIQSASWMEAGYVVDDINLNDQQVTFRKRGVAVVYNVQREGDTVLWNGAMVKALREHMRLTQSQMAQELGMRQQTISEWETGVYKPKRSTSKFLSIIAERAGFEYEPDTGES